MNYVFKRSENDYIVELNKDGTGAGYNVVPLDIDPYNKYTIEEVEAYLSVNRDKLLSSLPNNEPTQQELYQREITQIKEFLNDTDYIVIKCAEMGLNIAQEYPTEHEQRTTARARINELEALINAENVFED